MDLAFNALQARLPTVWPSMTLRTARPQLRTVVVVHSISFDVPAHLAPVFPAYEERFLCLVLSLLRAPGPRVVYVTSQTALPRVVDYRFSLVKGLDTAEARGRLFLVSPVDGSARPLTAKLLDRPRACSSGSGVSSSIPSWRSSDTHGRHVRRAAGCVPRRRGP